MSIDPSHDNNKARGEYKHYASKPSFYFYDLETSGFNPKQARIMQFAGQRTDSELKPIGEPDDFLIKMTEDILPDPGAVLVTGITPQKTIAQGYSEVEFLEIFQTKITLPGTIFVGFNNIRFDDEFMRYLHYRNFYDPYEWHWQHGRSRWDLLDLTRLTRALRPDGIKWPFDSEGKPSNRLELLSSANHVEHENAHDALSDTRATIAIARIIKNKQPKLFDYMLKMRSKKNIKALVNKWEPFLYASGKYSSESQKTAAVIPVATLPGEAGALVYDLSYDPKPFLKMSSSELADIWTWSKDKDENSLQLPVKSLMFNRCPAVAPLSVLDKPAIKRLKLNLNEVKNHAEILRSDSEFAANLLQAINIMDKRRQKELIGNLQNVDEMLYEGFFSENDKIKMRMVRGADSNELADLNPGFKDTRLQTLFPLYKARNFPSSLSDQERSLWEQFKKHKLLGGGDESLLSKYLSQLKELESRPKLNKYEKYLIEELKLYGELIMPI